MTQNIRAKNREFLSWVDTYESLETVRIWGNKFSAVGLFFFTMDSTGMISGSLPTNTVSVVNTWPHIRWLLTVKNDGYEDIARSVLTNQTYQNNLISEIHRILNENPWAAGIDFDFERLPPDLETEIYALYQRIYSEVKGRANGNWVHLDLPPMTGPRETIGPEKWCVYEWLAPYCDTAQIMTYGFTWSGSGVGSTSPVWWVKDVMSYAIQALGSDKVTMGVPAYGHRWQIYDYPGKAGVYPTGSYRGVGAGFDPFLQWMLGELSHTDQYRTGTETQPYIPFAAFYDKENYHNVLYLHIYDYPGAGEQDSLSFPMVEDDFDRKFLASYNKQQLTTFSGVIIDRTGASYDEKNGALEDDGTACWAREPQLIPDPNDPTGQTMIMEDPGTATWYFNVPTAGYYDVVVQVNFPWWDKQLLYLTLDGAGYYVGNKPQWYPYHRTVHWIKLGNIYLSAGSHTLILNGANGQNFTRFYGFRVCTAFTDKFDGGQAVFTVRPRKFYDVNKNRVWPYQGKFKVTLETLRRDPDHVIIWYDDFRDWQAGGLPGYYNVISGSWSVSKDSSDTSPRPYSWVSGSGEFRIDYSSFTDITVRTNMKTNGSGRGGVVFGSLWLAMNTSNGNLELYSGGSLVQSYAAGFKPGIYYQIKMRVRGSEITAYIGPTKVFTATAANPGAASFGIKSDVSVTSDLLVAGDSYWMYPQEAFDVTLPDDTTQTIGRIPRSGVTWDSYWEFFRLDSGEESSTRSVGPDGLPTAINKEWDYVHSQVFTLANPGDYRVTIKARDMGAWLSTVFLGDADGFSICVFPDADTVIKMSDLAAYDLQIRGIGMWYVGTNDPALWPMLVNQV